MDREERIAEIRRLEQHLYNERREIEQEIEREEAERLLKDGVLRQVEFIISGNSLFAVSGQEEPDIFDDYYSDNTFSHNLQLTEDVGLFANFDDGDYILSATSYDKLVEFAKEHQLIVDTESVERKIERLQNTIDNLTQLISGFKEESSG